MPNTILATKLYIPPPRSKGVLRPRLIEQLNEGLTASRKLSLISAPAGFGKTTLVSEWCGGNQGSVAWLSLDEGDSDPIRFLIYLVSALQTIAPNIGDGVLAVLHAAQSQPPPIESILMTLLNEISALQSSFVLVLDDYHLIEAKSVDIALAFLLEHLPKQMHLVITTREDPSIPLARLRVRGQLIEIRAADLRFTPSEAARFLNQVMGLNLSAQDAAALEMRTEGWIAGLQLAALSMRGREDVDEFIKSFAGDDRYIVDYLVEEVLHRQPHTVRSFLLQTSILDRLNGPLCDAVTGQADSSAQLVALQRGNFFVVPLDDKRVWYRYHHLFADVLHMHLLAEQPDQVAALHRRASEWYEQNGSAADAIRHALAGEDFERAAGLIELGLPGMSRSRQEEAMLGWLRALPEALVRNRPVLCNVYAGVLMQTGKLEGVDGWLRAAERWLDPVDTQAPEAARHEQPESPTAKMVVVDETEYRRLPGAIAIHRAGQALMFGNVADTLKYARRALDLAPEDDYLRRGGAAALQGLAFWTSGDLEAGQRMYVEGMAWLRRAGNISDVLGCALAVADIHIAQGRLQETMRTYERALRLAADHGSPVIRGTADMLVGMSELYRERNELQAATQYLLRSKKQGEFTGLPQSHYRWRVAMAGIQAAKGDLNGALILLDEAERLYVSDFSPNVRPVAALKARMWAAQGRFEEAFDWARAQGLSVEDNLSYLREFEHITLVRILLAQYKSDRKDSAICEAVGLLERLFKAAQEGGRTGSAIEICVLQAIAYEVQSKTSWALARLEQALKLAEPEGYVRMFLDEGANMAQLLREAAARGILQDYTGKLLAAFRSEQQQVAINSTNLTSPAFQPRIEPAAQNVLAALSPKCTLVDPLSQRELEILRLFKTELSGPEIAQELMIALSTVRTHTNNIYTKLNVINRRAAIKRAVEMNLI